MDNIISEQKMYKIRTMRHQNEQNHRASGFTLIEILVVISILGLVASVALANLQGAKDSARIAAGQQFHASVQHSLGADVIGQWEFNEGAGTADADVSGNGLDGTIIGTGEFYTPNGMSGSALAFDGDDVVSGVGFPNPGADSNLTVSAWIFPTDIASGGTIFSQGDQSCGFEITIVGGVVQSSSKSFGEAPPLQMIGTPTRTIVNGSWQEFTLEYNQNVITTYINGEKILSNSVSLGTGNCPVPTWTIGENFTGLIDRVTVYGSDLGGQTN